jgi:hypothetical protein
MQTPPKKEPLAVQVECKICGLIQEYRGQIPCNRCKRKGSLQLVRRKE